MTPTPSVSQRFPLFACPIRKAEQDRWLTLFPSWFLANGQYILIPAGYKSDFASIPWWTPNIVIPVGGLSAMPAIAHDWMYESGCVSRKLADDTFRRLLKQTGMAGWQYNLMYNYVRLFGWVRYKKRKQL
ncbi:DUF1353 domain-containing protein [Spirosoma pomorum]